MHDQGADTGLEGQPSTVWLSAEVELKEGYEFSEMAGIEGRPDVGLKKGRRTRRMDMCMAG